MATTRRPTSATNIADLLDALDAAIALRRSGDLHTHVVVCGCLHETPDAFCDEHTEELLLRARQALAGRATTAA